MTSGPAKTIVWFRRDLRIEDNHALASACRDGFVLPVFIWCPEEEKQFYPGRCSRWWLKQSLAHLDNSLRSLGSPLVFIKSESTLAALVQCIEVIGATRVVYNHLYDHALLARDQKIRTQLADIGISVQSFNGDLLNEPWDVYDEDGIAFTTFDSYWDKCMSLPREPSLLLPPWKIVPPTGKEKVESCSLEGLCLENDAERSSNALLERGWSPGWSNADKLLTEFISGHLINYSKNLMKVDSKATSLLSPYLHFGELSVRKIYRSVRMTQIQWSKEGKSEADESVNLFLRAIGLREYSHYLGFNFPFTRRSLLLGNLSHHAWYANEGNFKSWRQGRTGYPMVDAGMRELWATGWVHNRIRVIAAYFFVKVLLLPWSWGMKYFWDTLLDVDLECDFLDWRSISDSLADGHELNSLDNPKVQGYSFDPNGEYVRTWLPELARMPTEWIHHPWNAPKSILEAAGVELGVNYPNPLVKMDPTQECLNNDAPGMWELDRSARIGELEGSAEVVADNLLSTNVLDIRKAVINEISVASPFDQRVPSVQNLKSSLHEKGAKKLNGKRPKETETNNWENNIMTSEIIEEDSLSTAESSSTRKRTFNERHCDVLTPCLSSSFSKSQHSIEAFKPLDMIRSASVHLHQGSNRNGVNKMEEVEARSSIEGQDHARDPPDSSMKRKKGCLCASLH